MKKIMRHKDENESLGRITVADMARGSDSYFSLADFVKLNLGQQTRLIVHLQLSAIIFLTLQAKWMSQHYRRKSGKA